MSLSIPSCPPVSSAVSLFGDSIGSMAAGESLYVSMVGGAWGSVQGQTQGVIRVSLETLTVIGTHSTPYSPRSQLSGISHCPESPGSLGSQTCLDLNPSSALTSSGSQSVNIYVASIAQALGSEDSGKQDRYSP